MPNSLQTIYNVSIYNTGPPLFNTKLNLILFINLNLESRLIPNDIPNLTKLLAHTCIPIKIFHLRNILRKKWVFCNLSEGLTKSDDIFSCCNIFKLY